MSGFFTALSDIVGWIYFFAWSISFYPIAITNYKYKNTVGVSIDFTFINVCGYYMYGIYVCTGIIYPDIGTHRVSVQDIFYVGHAIMLSGVYFTQSLIYDNGGQKISKFMWLMLGAMIITIMTVFTLEMNHIGVNQYWNTAMI